MGLLVSRFGRANGAVAPQAVRGSGGDVVGVDLDLVADHAKGVVEFGDLREHAGLVTAQDVKAFGDGVWARDDELGVAADVVEGHAGRPKAGADFQPFHLFLGEHAPAGRVATDGRKEQALPLVEAQRVRGQAGELADLTDRQGRRGAHGFHRTWLAFEWTRTPSVGNVPPTKGKFVSTTWFITGTSSGFGRLLTEQLLDRGDRVAATLRRPEALDDLRAEHGDRLWVAPLDVTDTDEVHRVVDDAFAALGGIDVVVNNAGYGVFASVEEASDEQIRRVVNTNLLGSVHVIRAALPHLRAQGRGHILQVSTAGGQTTYPNFGYYHASKWGIEGFCQTVAAEIAPFGIKLTIVEPGATPTGFGSGLDTAPAMPEYDATPAGDVRRALADGAFPLPSSPDKIAAAMIELVDSGAAPLRLPLGSDTYQDVRSALVARLQEHDAHRDVAYSVTRDDIRH